MTSSTLGGLIKDYRMQRGMSQTDIAFSLGWKQTSRLSRIEQGITEKPPRELLDNIIHAIDLEEEEKNTLLLTGGYIPTEEEIEQIRKETNPIIEQWPYPAFVFDFSWRILSHNKHNSHIYKMSEEDNKMLEKYHPRILDILFDPNFRQNKMLKTSEAENWIDFLRISILNFKYEQRHRTKEKWYIDHVKNLMRNDFFRELWVETDVREKIMGMVGKFTPKNIIHPDDENKLLHFFRFSAPMLKDPRIELYYLIPRDSKTYDYYQSV